MPKEYIEREKARELIDNYGKNAVDLGRWNLDPVDDIIALAKGVDKIPSVDVVEVVRCKDCENCETCTDGEKYCELHSDGWGDDLHYVDDDGYCSCGVRNEDRNENRNGVRKDK